MRNFTLVAVVAFSALVSGLLSTAAVAAESDFVVTLLGTASPQALPDRFGPSTLVEAGEQKLIIDAGRGVPIRLGQLGIPIGEIDALLLTHFHSDHTSGIPDLWLTGWLPIPPSNRTSPFRVIGPTGTRILMSNLEEAYAADITIRLADQQLPPEGIAVAVEEFITDGVVYDEGGVKVTAFAVNHGELIKPAYGYRIDYDGRSVLVSGDTKFDENVIAQGTGADLIIHEVMAARPELLTMIAMQRIIEHHTTPREAGIVFNRARPKLAVYTHIILAGTPENPLTIDEMIAETRETYSGPLVAGEDLMSFQIGDEVITRQFEH